MVKHLWAGMCMVPSMYTAHPYKNTYIYCACREILEYSSAINCFSIVRRKLIHICNEIQIFYFKSFTCDASLCFGALCAWPSLWRNTIYSDKFVSDSYFSMQRTPSRICWLMINKCIDSCCYWGSPHGPTHGASHEVEKNRNQPQWANLVSQFCMGMTPKYNIQNIGSHMFWSSSSTLCQPAMSPSHNAKGRCQPTCTATGTHAATTEGEIK